MSDQDFQNRVLEHFARLEEQRREDNLRFEKQRTEDNQRIEKSLDAIEVRMQEDNQRIEKRLDAIEVRMQEDNQRIEKRLDAIEVQVSENAKSISTLAVDVGWIKEKLETKGEERTALIAKIAAGTAICSAIIAVIALFV